MYLNTGIVGQARLPKVCNFASALEAM